MSSRVNKPDTQADVTLQQCISASPPQSFIMKAGAGSGKTTSLIKGLSGVVALHGERLRKNRQRIACITYTEIAAGEIWRDVGNNPLVHVSTIHSFMWLLARSFQSDIRDWVSGRIDEKIAKLTAEQTAFGPRVQQRTKDKAVRDLARLHRQATQIGTVSSFRYGTGSDYPKGILGHDDIIKLGPYLLTERPLFRMLTAQQFPFVFVDESQDTTLEVIAALKAIGVNAKSPLCLGFFGDPMQRIYATGTGSIDPEPGWVEIPKPENYRCSKEVLAVANAIRRDGDDLIQVAGERLGPDGAIPTQEGAAKFFVLPADDKRDDNLRRVRASMAHLTGDADWAEGPDDATRIKLLVIVHRMAAKRLGFGDLYGALNDKAPDTFKNGFLDASAWPLRPFVSFILPLAAASAAGRQLDVMRLLRRFSPLMDKDTLKGRDVAKQLKKIGQLVASIAQAFAEGSAATMKDVLATVQSSGLYVIDSRLTAYLEPPASDAAEELVDEAKADVSDDDDDDGEELSKEIAAMDRFLSCPVRQLLPYETYVAEESPFRTQQGIKGAEFDRVLVVLDDEEGTHNQFSYEKYLGLKALSDNDLKNQREGKETTVDRTRRLFYVSCTRALKDLAVVLFTADPGAAAASLRNAGIFESANVLTHADLLP
ncbi:ATP-dependent helicase [Agrobacterium rhizogenes]|nr:ATP-dependent helicase [Rhizobium rhizogenes]NTF79004.1 ATP-dependent helicase [Rhizobium rhizogenes]